jgi:hypothetical protein
MQVAAVQKEIAVTSFEALTINLQSVAAINV